MRLLYPGRGSLNKICATVSGPVPSYSPKKACFQISKAPWRADHCSASTVVFLRHPLREQVSLTLHVLVVTTKRGPVETEARKEKKEARGIRDLR